MRASEPLVRVACGHYVRPSDGLAIQAQPSASNPFGLVRVAWPTPRVEYIDPGPDGSDDPDVEARWVAALLGFSVAPAVPRDATAAPTPRGLEIAGDIKARVAANLEAAGLDPNDPNAAKMLAAADAFESTIVDLGEPTREQLEGGYPLGWPRCPRCGRPTINSHMTCGDARCDEQGHRTQRSASGVAVTSNANELTAAHVELEAWRRWAVSLIHKEKAPASEYLNNTTDDELRTLVGKELEARARPGAAGSCPPSIPGPYTPKGLLGDALDLWRLLADAAERIAAAPERCPSPCDPGTCADCDRRDAEERAGDPATGGNDG